MNDREADESDDLTDDEPHSDDDADEEPHDDNDGRRRDAGRENPLIQRTLAQVIEKKPGR